VGAFEVGFARSEAEQSVGAGMDDLPDDIAGIGGGHCDQCDAFACFHRSSGRLKSSAAGFNPESLWLERSQVRLKIPRLVSQTLHATPTSVLNPRNLRSSLSMWFSYGWSIRLCGRAGC